MDPRNIRAIQDTVQAGIHRPGSEWRRQDEARRLGKPYIPADMAEPGKQERWLNALARCAVGTAAANKGVG